MTINDREQELLEANNRYLERARAAEEEARTQANWKNAVYLERNKLVALLASIFPSGVKQTAIDGWSEDWHGCVYIDFPWGQASWHFHTSQAHLFAHLPPYYGNFDGHTTEEKYEAIVREAKGLRERSPHAVIKRIADVASAVGWQSGEPAVEAAGHIVSVLAIHPEHVDRFLAEGPELFIDGTFKPENGSLTYRSIGGDILSPTVLRKAQGSAQ